MSFGINPPSRNLSNVQASSKSQDGGAGNTGYFRRENTKEEVELNFSKNYSEDSFVKQDKTQTQQGLLELIKKLFLQLLDLLSELFVKKAK